MNTKQSLIALICFTAVLFTACKKGNIQYQFEGKITESITGMPVSNVNIRISQKAVVNSGATIEDFTIAGSGESDSNGDFNIVFDRKKVTDFFIEIKKEDYFPIEILESSANISTENVNRYDRELEPISWIEFQITNNFPDDNDHYKIIRQTFREGCEECAENTTLNFFGAVDTSITYATTAGVYNRFVLINVTNGVSVFDSIKTIPFQTITYPISY